MRSFIHGLGLGVVLIFSPGPAQAAEQPSAGTPDSAVPTASLSATEVDAIVLKFQGAYADTFDRRDAPGMAALLTDDATFQTEGVVTQGRAKIEANLVRLMAKLPKGTKLEDTATSSRAISLDLIVCHGISHRIAADGTSSQMFFMRVLVRRGDRWLLDATQEAHPASPN